MNRPLIQNARFVYASSCYELACYLETDGREPDMDILVKCERLWSDILHDSSADADAQPADSSSSGTGLPTSWRPAVSSTLHRSDVPNPSMWRTVIRPSLLDAARDYARQIKGIDQVPARLSFRQVESRRRMADDAVAKVRAAVAAGFNDGRGLSAPIPRLAASEPSPRFRPWCWAWSFPSQPFALP